MASKWGGPKLGNGKGGKALENVGKVNGADFPVEKITMVKYFNMKAGGLKSAIQERQEGQHQSHSPKKQFWGRGGTGQIKGM